MSLTLNIFPALPTPDNIFPIKMGKDRIASESENKYKVSRHRSSIATRAFILSFKNRVLTDRNLLRNFIVQQDMGITPFLYKHPVEDLTIFAESGNQDALVELNAETTGNIGQGFQIPVQSAIHRVQLLLNKVGSPTGQLSLKIQTDTADEPSGTTLSTSDNVAVTSLGTTLALVSFDFNTTTRLNPFVQYHFVLEGDSTYDSGFATGVTAVRIGVDSSSPSYTYGAISTYGSGSWTADSTKCGIFTVPDYIKCETEESTFNEERISGASGGIFNLGIHLNEKL